jgi:hypothetical protein
MVGASLLQCANVAAGLGRVNWPKGRSAIEDGSDFSTDPASRSNCSTSIFKPAPFFARVDGGDGGTAVETDAPSVGPRRFQQDKDF